MHKQLVLLHNAVSAYFSGNAVALDGTLKQFNIKVNFYFCIYNMCLYQFFYSIVL